MFWSEKIQVLKERFRAPEFRDPMSAGNAVIEKIIRDMLKTTWLNFHNELNRETLLKNGRLIKQCTIPQLYKDELGQLDPNTNYWLLLVHVPMGTDFRVYDCRPAPLKELLYLSSGEPHREFYIVDKKYSWLLYYKLDKMKDEVQVYELRKYT